MQLSPEQEQFLKWMLFVHRMEDQMRAGTGKVQLEEWGVKLKNLPRGADRSRSASRSRMLRRLEERGLVERRNRSSGDRYSEDPEDTLEVREELGLVQHRTTHVRFTEKGREVAERLERESA